MRILHEGASFRGRRKNNEDALLSLPGCGLFAVADGMGGYEGGEVASRSALASVQAYCELLGDEQLGLSREDTDVAHQRLGLAIRIADREVRRRATGKLAKMGTTIACLALTTERALIAHVGDSRVYRLRDGEIMTLTRDHSLYNQIEAAGLVGLPERRLFRFSNIITQALGQGPDVTPDLALEEVRAGDRFLLCSDGLSDVLDEDTIGATMNRPGADTDTLISAAFEAGSRDNITALIVSVVD